MLKRALDITLSGAGLCVISPVLVGIGVAVKLDSRGPALYGHERVGRDWKRFKVWKFRTMVQDADQRGASVTAGGDPRVTRLGRFLRSTKLDELPQLYNVLKGDMSLVGPRPEAARYAEAYPDDYDEILQVRPGITDDATIAFRREEEVLAAAEDPEQAYIDEVLPEKIRMYQDYIRNRSNRRDLKILARTLWHIASR